MIQLACVKNIFYSLLPKYKVLAHIQLRNDKVARRVKCQEPKTAVSTEGS